MALGLQLRLNLYRRGYYGIAALLNDVADCFQFLRAHTRRPPTAYLFGDQHLFLKADDQRTVGLLCSYADDLRRSGSDFFLSLMEEKLRTFDSKRSVLDNVEVVGVLTDTLPGTPRRIKLSQELYVTAARSLPMDITADAFASTQAVFGWLAASRPECWSAINRAAAMPAAGTRAHTRSRAPRTPYAHTVRRPLKVAETHLWDRGRCGSRGRRKASGM